MKNQQITLTINLKLGLVFAVILAIIVGLSAFAILRMAAIGDHMNEIRTNWLPSVQAIGDLRNSASQFRVYEPQHIMNTDDAKMKSIEARLAELQGNVEKSQKVYAALISSPEEQALYNRFVSTWSGYVNTHRKWLEKSRKNENEAARDIFADEGQPQFDAALGLLDQLVKLNADGSDSEAQAGNAAEAQARVMMLIVTSIAAVLVVLAIIGVYILVSKRLRDLEGRMTTMARKDYETPVPHTAANDEIGAMARTLLIFRDGLKEADRLAAEQAETQERRAAETQAQLERERQAGAEIADLVNAVAHGDVSRRLSTQGKEGVFLTIAEGINQLTGAIETVVGQIGSVLGAMAEGNLTGRITGDFDGVFGKIKDDTNAMADKLADIVSRLSEASAQVSSAAGEISTGSTDLAQRTESQAASLEETAASMHEITTTVKQNADNAQAANQLAVAARDTAEKGGSVVANAVSAVTQIESSAQKISDIVGLIDEIAFQTNLLALNASVEAARAGEAGKGFAVVAQEVRALAQRSAEASRDIKALITESNSQVKTGAMLVNQTGSSLTEIVTAIKKVSDIVAEIAAASREQATGLDQINTAVGTMDEMTQRNGALVEETSASAQSLSEQARALNELIGFFRVPTMRRAA